MEYKSLRNETNPCYKCPDRQVGCHGKCEKYQSWNSEHTEAKEAKRRAKRAENDADSMHWEGMRRSIKRRGAK